VGPDQVITLIAQLRAGLLGIGVQQDEAWRLLAKVALDGMTGGRRRVLDTLAGRSLDRATSTVAGFARLPETTPRRHLEDLTAIGVVERRGDFPACWCLSEWAADLWQRLDLPVAKSSP
jgi:hypothetical protein